MLFRSETAVEKTRRVRLMAAANRGRAKARAKEDADMAYALAWIDTKLPDAIEAAEAVGQKCVAICDAKLTRKALYEACKTIRGLSLRGNLWIEWKW
jgi:hypothetical protein